MCVCLVQKGDPPPHPPLATLPPPAFEKKERKKHFLSDQWKGGDTQTLLLFLRGIRKGSNADLPSFPFPLLGILSSLPPPTNGNSPTYSGGEQCHKAMGEREKEEEEGGDPLACLPGLGWLAWLSFLLSSHFLAFKCKYVGGLRRRAEAKREGVSELGYSELA